MFYTQRKELYLPAAQTPSPRGCEKWGGNIGWDNLYLEELRNNLAADKNLLGD